MSIQFVNSVANKGASASSTIVAPAIAVAAGNTLIACISCYNNPKYQVASVTDTMGNVYTLCGTVDGGGIYHSQEVWRTKAATAHSANIITVTYTGSAGSRVLSVLQYSGVANYEAKSTLVLDALGTTHTTGNVTTASTESLIIGFFVQWNGGSIITASAPSTSRVNQVDSLVSEKIGTVTGAYSLAATSNISDNYAMVAYSFTPELTGSRMATFTRASVAYSPSTGLQVASGVPRYAPSGTLIEEGTTNLLPNANILSGWGMTAGTITVQSPSLFPAVNVLRVVRDASVEDTYAEYHIGAIPPNTPVTLSFWVRGSGDTAGFCFLQELGGGYRSVTSGYSGGVSSNWQRIVLSGATPSDVVPSLRVILRPSTSSSNYIEYTGIQVEAKDHATAFTPGTRPDRYSNGSGILIEEGTTNVAKWTEDFSNAIWTTSVFAGTGTAPIKTPNYALAPDGSMTACRIQANRGAGNSGGDYSVVRQNPGVAGTRTAWIKSNTGVNQSVALGPNATLIVTATPAWSLVECYNASTTNFDIGSIGTLSSTNNVDICIWHPQQEAKTYRTSYVMSNASSGVRNAEILTIPTANILSMTEGAVCCRVNIDSLATLKVFFSDYNLSTFYLQCYVQTNGKVVYRVGNMAVDTTVNSVITPGTSYHFMVRWSSTLAELLINGIVVKSSATTITTFNPILHIGEQSGNQFWLNGVLDEFKIYNKRPSDSEAAQIAAGVL